MPVRPQGDFVLTQPVTIEGQRYEKLTLRRPVAADLLKREAMEGSSLLINMQFLALLCGTSTEVIKALDLSDYLALDGRAELFFEPATPEQPPRSSPPVAS